MSVSLIWARTRDGVIGSGGGLPWHLPEDLARFRSLTGGHPVVMGRATWESLPERFRPLPGRRNVVLSRSDGFDAPGAEVVGSLPAALELLGDEDVWVVGGGAVYAQALPLAGRVEVTVVGVAVDGDTWAPDLPDDEWREVASDPVDGWHMSSQDVPYRFESYVRR
ncbi:dihydrofolate reductase [Cellulomonas rhizosphaerae]|uniref:Dihydrofolate reductase n=1 Tax=Cellulomonas rhizosphaerae TaxID=2293719 RepID=A0A413RNM6_9CELL|nr:dihydrofolate reductase [Cellulomonas rhizosphaerae]RHA43567.1 dihydrofolate reductase [Cellulomonas rhizosphaerae]